MASLTDQDRWDVWAQFMQETSAKRELIDGLAKPELRAAVDAVDSWIDVNQALFNAAIPQPARAQLTSAQKAALLMYVVTKRFEVE